MTSVKCGHPKIWLLNRKFLFHVEEDKLGLSKRLCRQYKNVQHEPYIALSRKQFMLIIVMTQQWCQVDICNYSSDFKVRHNRPFPHFIDDSHCGCCFKAFLSMWQNYFCELTSLSISFTQVSAIQILKFRQVNALWSFSILMLAVSHCFKDSNISNLAVISLSFKFFLFFLSFNKRKGS